MKSSFAFAIVSVLVQPACDGTPSPTPPAEAAPQPKPAPAVRETPEQPVGLSELLPDRLGGMQRDGGGGFELPPDHAHAAYFDASGKSINVNLSRVADLQFEKAQFHGLADGQVERNDAAKLEHKGHAVEGHAVERTFFTSGSAKSEARVLFADTLALVVSVQPAADPDESVKVLRELDLAAIAARAKAP